MTAVDEAGQRALDYVVLTSRRGLWHQPLASELLVAAASVVATKVIRWFSLYIAYATVTSASEHADDMVEALIIYGALNNVDAFG